MDLVLSLAQKHMTELPSIVYFLFQVFLLLTGMTICHMLAKIGIFLGIIPRYLSLGTPLRLIASWTIHADLSHLLNNLTPLLFSLVIVDSKLHSLTDVATLMTLIVIASGVLCWLFAAPNTVTIGASGLVYGLFGWIACSWYFSTSSISYTVITTLYLLSYTASMALGLLYFRNISFISHAGGLVVGLVIGFLEFKH